MPPIEVVVDDDAPVIDFDSMLKPEGSMEEDSVSLQLHKISDHVSNIWTNPDFQDSRPFQQVVKELRKQAHGEVDIAIEQLMRTF